MPGASLLLSFTLCCQLLDQADQVDGGMQPQCKLSLCQLHSSSLLLIMRLSCNSHDSTAAA
jgi:hypothetical protein